MLGLKISQFDTRPYAEREVCGYFMGCIALHNAISKYPRVRIRDDFTDYFSMGSMTIADIAIAQSGYGIHNNGQ